MDNIKKVVKKHNNNLLGKNDTNKRTCNCGANNTCSLDAKSLSSNIVYSAEDKSTRRQCFRIYEEEFKTRLGN